MGEEKWPADEAKTMPCTLIISLQSTPTDCKVAKEVQYQTYCYQEGHSRLVPRLHGRRKWPENKATAMKCQ